MISPVDLKEPKTDYLVGDERFIIKLASVFAGAKPAVLFSLCNRTCQKGVNPYQEWDHHKQKILDEYNISVMTMRKSESKNLLYFYDKELLSFILKKKSITGFLKNLGYYSCENMEDYLGVLKKRFSKYLIPHEIGLFLGYPLKDVVGFMCKELPAVYSDRWKVFGEPGCSVSLMEYHKKAEVFFKKCIQEGRDPFVYRRKIRRHFEEKVRALV